MTDNVNLPLTGAGGTTATVASEDIGGVQYQRVKLVESAAASTVTGATAVIGKVALSSGTQTIGTVVATSGVILGAGSTTNSIGSVAIVAGSSANTIGSVVSAAGSSAVMMGGVALSSGNPVYLGAGTTDTYQFMQSIPFSSGSVTRTSISTTVDTQIIAANANRKALVIANRSTAQTVGIGFSTASVTTALANVDCFIGPSSFLSFGLQGGLPLVRGPIRGINLTSTTVAGSVGVVEFT